MGRTRIKEIFSLYNILVDPTQVSVRRLLSARGTSQQTMCRSDLPTIFLRRHIQETTTIIQYVSLRSNKLLCWYHTTINDKSVSRKLRNNQRRICIDYILPVHVNGCKRPYHVDSTASRSLSEVKQRRVCLVLRWGTTLESSMLLIPFALSPTCGCSVHVVVDLFGDDLT